MKSGISALVSLALALLAMAGGSGAVARPVKQWTDTLTGHEIVQITNQPGGAASLYFHQNSYTPQGDKMVISTPEGISVVTLADWSVRPLVRGAELQLLFTGRKTRSVYYASRGRNNGAGATTIFAADIDSGKVRRIATVAKGSIGSINADETLLLGQWAASDKPLQPDGTASGKAPEIKQQFGQAHYAANGPDSKALSFAEAKEVRLNERLEAKIPMEIFTIDIRTGERKLVVASTDWLNHVQFSPTDPGLILYCHEGPWHKVDRIWTIRTDGSGKQQVHKRLMNMEIAGHEFFSPDGKWIWYDLQTPRGEVFWLAGYEIATGKRRWYHVDRNMWSVHYNQAPDMTRFSGDGGDSEMVAHAPDGKYLYLFTPRAIPDVAGIHADNAADLIAPGTLEAEKIVDMRRHDYRLEPNITFTPDGQWMIFRSNMDGSNQVYAVRVALSNR